MREKLVSWIENHPFGFLVVVGVTITYLAILLILFLWLPILFALAVTGLWTSLYAGLLHLIKDSVDS